MDFERKKNFWSQLFGIALIFTIIMFIIMTKQEDASTGAIIFAMLMFVGIALVIISIVKVNIYNAKSQNMSADEYLSDRFANAIPETKETFGIKSKTNVSVKCPYCNTTNVKKISTVNRAISTSMVGIASSKIGKQWHCNNCGSDF